MSDLNFRPLIEDMTWSYSRLQAFDQCPYAWYLKYIHYPKIPDESNFYARFGTLIHKLLARFYAGEITGDEALLLFLTEFTECTKGSGNPKPSTVQKYFEEGQALCRSLQPLKFEVQAVEEKINFKIDNIPFVCYVDFIGKNNDGLVIVDHKSKELKPRSKRKKPTLKDQELDDMLRQLYIYSEAVRQKYGELPKLLCFNCYRAGTLIEEPFNDDAFNSAIQWAKDKVDEILDADDFYPKLESFMCRSMCGLHQSCCYYENL